MKEIEKAEIKRLSDRLDAIRHEMPELHLINEEIGRASCRERV